MKRSAQNTAGLAASIEEMLRFLDSARPRPRATSQPPEVNLPASAVAEQILEILVSSRNRKGSLKGMGFESSRPSMLVPLTRCVAARKPIELTLMAFPFKVPNPAKTGHRRLPDLAELAALRRIGELHDEIRTVYTPGLVMNLIHDGSYIAEIFGVTQEEVQAYEAYMQELIEISGLRSVVRTHDFFALLYANRSDVAARIESIGIRASEWLTAGRGTDEWTSCFNSTLGMVDLRELSPVAASQVMRWAVKGKLPTQYRDLESRTLEAMLRYRVRDMLLHECDPRSRAFPDALHVTTIDRPGRLAIWLVRRGRSQLPWHGVGVVDAGGRLSVLTYREVQANTDLEPIWFGDDRAPFGYTAIPFTTRAYPEVEAYG